MSAVSMPVIRPIGRALVVAPPAARLESVRLLHEMGYETTEADEPYGAMRELCNHRLAYSALILCLAGLYREELALIASVKRRFSHLEVWLTQTDGRQAALADGLRMGADGLLAADGLHRIASEESPVLAPPAAPMVAVIKPAPAPPADPMPVRPIMEPPPDDNMGEPVLTAEELRALLQDQPLAPPSESNAEQT